MAPLLTPIMIIMTKIMIIIMNMVTGYDDFHLWGHEIMGPLLPPAFYSVVFLFLLLRECEHHITYRSVIKELIHLITRKPHLELLTSSIIFLSSSPPQVNANSSEGFNWNSWLFFCLKKKQEKFQLPLIFLPDLEYLNAGVFSYFALLPSLPPRPPPWFCKSSYFDIDFDFDFDNHLVGASEEPLPWQHK